MARWAWPGAGVETSDESWARRSRPTPTQQWLCIAVIVLFHAWVSLAKPVHIDDTHYVYAARHVFVDPWTPFGNIINWKQEPGPAYLDNINPPGFYYLLAGWMAIVGESQEAWHLLPLAFVALAAWALIGIAGRFCRRPRVATALVLLSPTVLPSANLMVDLPSLAWALVALRLWIRGVDTEDRRATWAAGIVAGVAVLTKYQMLVVLPVMAGYAVLRGTWRPLAALAPAPVLLALWSWHNVLVYPEGQPHFSMASAYRPFERTAHYWWQSFIALGQVLGASIVVPPVALFAWRRLIGWAGWIACGAILLLLTPTATPWWKHPVFHSRTELLTFGVATLAILVLAASAKPVGTPLSRDLVFLWGWLTATMGGLFVLAHHQAPRYHWLALVPAVLLVVRGFDLVVPAVFRRPLWALTLILHGGTGVLVAAADFVHAKASAVAPVRVAQRSPPQQVWCVGHWGFQFACEELGFETLDSVKGSIAAGDWVAIPRNSSLENLPRQFRPLGSGRPLCRGTPLFDLIALDDYYHGSDVIAAEDGWIPRSLAAVYDLWPFAVTAPPDAFLYSVRAPTVPYSWLHSVQERRWQTGGSIEQVHLVRARCDIDLSTLPSTP